MRAHLMYRHRDFDPKQKGPFNDADLVADLGMTSLFETMAGGDELLREAASAALLTGPHDPDAIVYRQEALRDCLANDVAVRDIYELAGNAIAGEKKIFRGLFHRYPEIILHREIEALVMFVPILRELRKVADEHADEFRSEAFTTFFTMLQKELDDEYFTVIDQHLRTLRFRNGTLISATLGTGVMGSDYVLRRPLDDRSGWLARITGKGDPSYSFSVPARDEAGARALGDLKNRGLNHVANALAQSTDHILAFFQALRAELGFYLGCLNLHARLAEKGEPICFPQPRPTGEVALSCTGLYDVALTLNLDGRTVPNDLGADGKPLLVITGANSGGKSTFLRALGLAQLMMQAGMFVGAQAYRASAARGVFTHYKREEDVTMTMGKLDEELDRMSQIADHVRRGSLVLSNESFASTNEAEGSEIGRQIVRALLESGVRVFAVTHLYDFTESLYAKRGGAAVFLRAERRDDGVRTFKLAEGEPLPTSFGEDLYVQAFGVEPVRK